MLPPDAVYLLSETRSFVLTGRLYARLAPLLDGEKSVAKIAELLDAGPDTAAVEYAIARLVGRGFVTFDGVEREDTPAFWGMLGIEPAVAQERLAAATVTVTATGTLSAGPLFTALQDLGVVVSTGSLDRIEPFSATGQRR